MLECRDPGYANVMVVGIDIGRQNQLDSVVCGYKYLCNSGTWFGWVNKCILRVNSAVV